LRRTGGTAEVFQVEAQGVLAAVKLARDTGGCTRMLDREREALQAISARDPGAAAWIVTVLDSGTEDGRPWVALPWFEHSLRSFVATAPGPAAVLMACERAAEALYRFHETGGSLGSPRLHRDVKPDNFLVGGDGRVVLADVGTSRADSLAGLSRPTAVGTPRYAPAEQSFELDRPPDPSVDAHALAVTVYACLAGVEPDSKGSFLPCTAAGARLLDLQVQRQPGPELEALRRRPVAELIRFDEMVSLTDGDIHRLRNVLLDDLRGDDTRADAVVAALVPALDAALQPDPALRMADLRRIAAALEVARVALGVAAPAIPPRAQFTPASPVPAAATMPGSDTAPGDAPMPGAVSVARAAPLADPEPSSPTLAPPAPPEIPEATADDDPVARYVVAALALALLAVAGWVILG
jgi:serine/threonine protein kinase